MIGNGRFRQKKVVFSNQKGGVGKTTLTRELGIYLASKGKSVLVIDLDPQANLTRSLTDEEYTGCHEALSDQCFEIAGGAEKFIAPFGRYQDGHA